MRAIRRTCLSLLLAAATACFAGPTTAPADLDAVFARLAADDAIDRETAQEQIVQMGVFIVEPLKALIEASTDIEQRTGAQAALARILENASVGPTMIRLKLNDTPAATAVEELAKKAGYPIRVFNNDGIDKRVSVDIDNQPFWNALQEITKKTGFSLQGGEQRLNLGSGASYYNGPVSIDGPFMIMARQIQFQSHVMLTQKGAGNKNMNMSFTCFVEPKIQISQRPYGVTLSDCLDDQGRSLLLNAGGFEGMSDGAQQIIWDAIAQLKVPEPDAKSISMLRGTMRVIAATKSDVLEIEDLMAAKNVTKNAAGYSLTVKNASLTNDQLTVNMSLTFPSQYGFQLLNQVKVIDAQGNQLPFIQSPGPVGGNRRIDYRAIYRLDDEKKAGKLKMSLSVPTESKPLEFNFQFKDLPLPK